MASLMEEILFSDRKAWRQLGDMAPEVAMEQYVTVLLRNIPGCIPDEVSVSSSS